MPKTTTFFCIFLYSQNPQTRNCRIIETEQNIISEAKARTVAKMTVELTRRIIKVIVSATRVASRERGVIPREAWLEYGSASTRRTAPEFRTVSHPVLSLSSYIEHKSEMQYHY